MTYITSWEEFSKAAERLYLNDPMKLLCSGMPCFKLLYAYLTWNHSRSHFVSCSTPGPRSCRFVIKYRHCDGKLCVKITDDAVCLQYRTEHNQDVKKLEKLTNQLMRHMASKEK